MPDHVLAVDLPARASASTSSLVEWRGHDQASMAVSWRSPPPRMLSSVLGTPILLLLSIYPSLPHRIELKR